MKCKCCGNNLGGSYVDYCKGLFIALCLACCNKLGYTPNNLKNQKKCAACNKYFQPKGVWQVACVDCWLKTKTKKQPHGHAVTYSKVPIQRELNIGVKI